MPQKAEGAVASLEKMLNAVAAEAEADQGRTVKIPVLTKSLLDTLGLNAAALHSEPQHLKSSR